MCVSCSALANEKSMPAFYTAFDSSAGATHIPATLKKKFLRQTRPLTTKNHLQKYFFVAANESMDECAEKYFKVIDKSKTLCFY
jgi:hypothetical protein